MRRILALYLSCLFALGCASDSKRVTFQTLKAMSFESGHRIPFMHGKTVSYAKVRIFDKKQFGSMKYVGVVAPVLFDHQGMGDLGFQLEDSQQQLQPILVKYMNEPYEIEDPNKPVRDFIALFLIIALFVFILLIIAKATKGKNSGGNVAYYVPSCNSCEHYRIEPHKKPKFKDLKERLLPNEHGYVLLVFKTDKKLDETKAQLSYVAK